MSGLAWRDRARSIVLEKRWPEGVSDEDREAVELLARGSGAEPYYTLKVVIEGIDGGFYRPSRFSRGA